LWSPGSCLGSGLAAEADRLYLILFSSFMKMELRRHVLGKVSQDRECGVVEGRNI
jgi:hypothetical protein